MRNPILLTVLLCMFAFSANAGPVITGATNAASYLSPDLPNGGLAQGSIATLFGTGLGPATVVQPSNWPLALTLGGVSVKVTVGTTTVDAIPIVSWEKQVSVIIPSTTPLGDGTVVLTYNGASSAPFPVKIVAHAFGIFALNQGGSGPGIFTHNVDQAHFVINTLLASAEPGSVWTIWGTGLGAVAGDEAGGPLPGNMTNLDVKVFVGGQEANVIYRGRSGCCAGLDQIAFYVPEQMSGCYVPVTVVVDDVPSNSVTMSVAKGGLKCSDAEGIHVADLDRAATQGDLAIGTITLARTRLKITAPPPVGEMTVTTDTGGASFERYDVNGLIRANSLPGLFHRGACYVYTFRADEQNPPDWKSLDPIQPVPLDAGPLINVTGPNGAKQLPKKAPGNYAANLGSNLPTPQLYLSAGAYQFNNGAGGADIGGFTADQSLPEPVVWTNADAINNVPAHQALQVTWTGGDPQNGIVVTSGVSMNTTTKAGAGFICEEKASAGQFTVPKWVIDSMPPTTVVDGVPTGFLFVTTSMPPGRFDAPGLDVGLITWSDMTMKNVSYNQ